MLSSLVWGGSDGVGGSLEASWSLESSEVLPWRSSLLGLPVAGVTCGGEAAVARRRGVPIIALTIRRCVRRSCCLRGSVIVDDSAPYIIVGMTVPRYSLSLYLTGLCLLVSSCLCPVKHAHAAWMRCCISVAVVF